MPVDNSKFSNFQDGGDLIADDIVVGLRDGVNTRFNYAGALPPSTVVPISQGGTGATTASAARTNLGLAIGVDVQAWSAILDDFAALVGATGKVPRYNGANWVASTATFANTYAASSLLYSNGTDTVTGLATANSATLVTNASGVPAWTASMTDGQVLIGVTGGTPILGTLTAGTNVSIVNAAGSITINATGRGTVNSGNQFELAYYATTGTQISGLTTQNSSALVTDASGQPAWLSSLTNGQLIIGNTGGTPTAATLTAGSGISIANAGGSITISGTGGGYSWTEVTGTSQAMAVNNGYIANNAGLVTLTLPATASVGDTVTVQGKGAGLFRIAQNAGQTIHFGSRDTTTGAGGYLEATQRYDSVELLCITANTDWAVYTAPQGVLTVA